MVREAIHRHGCPEIFNSDQGGQFTRSEFTGMLKAHGIRIRRGGKGSWRDNVFVERLWKTVKYEEVYLKAYDSVGEAKANLAGPPICASTTSDGLIAPGRVERPTPPVSWHSRLPSEPWHQAC